MPTEPTTDPIAQSRRRAQMKASEARWRTEYDKKIKDLAARIEALEEKADSRKTSQKPRA